MRSKYSMHYIDNALEKFDYVSTPGGVLSLLLAEIVHAIQLDCHVRLHEGIISTQTCSKDTLKEEEVLYQERIEANWYDYQPEVEESSGSDSDSSISSNGTESSSPDGKISSRKASYEKESDDENSESSTQSQSGDLLNEWEETNSVRSFEPPDNREMDDSGEEEGETKEMLKNETKQKKISQRKNE
jgi:hypothetical protein